MLEINKQAQPVVSVIIPLYNSEKYIADTIDSVVNQTYQNWEMIIVDDCSIDRSINIVKKYEARDNRIKLIESDSNFGGPARPRNIGLNNAKGRYIAFLDADDIWLSDKLAVQIDIMTKYNLSFTSTGCSLIDHQARPFKLNKLSDMYNKISAKKTLCDLIKNNFILTSSVLVEKKIIDFFSEDEKLVAVEDYDLWLRALKDNIDDYMFIDSELIMYRVLDSSISERGSAFKQEIKANLVICAFLLNNTKFINCWLKRILMNFVVRRILGK